MSSLRALIGNNRHCALALLMLAFCIKAVIPAGFMLSPSSDTVFSVTICSDAPGVLNQLQMVAPGKEQGGGHADGKKKSEHCAFSGLAKFAVSGADAFLLALAFTFILLLGIAPARRWPFRQVSYLRPPLRGPPATA